jgi:hypothetical protein
MKVFALLWLSWFLLLVIPVMRYDHYLKSKKNWQHLIEGTRALSDAIANVCDAMVRFEKAAQQANNSLLLVKNAVENAKTKN